MLNPGNMAWSLLCRNLKLRSRSYLGASSDPVPNFPAADAAVVERAVREQLAGAGSTLPVACTARMAAADGNGGEHRVSRLDFFWASLHRENEQSVPVLNTIRKRLLGGGVEKLNKAGAGAAKRRRKPPTGPQAAGPGKSLRIGKEPANAAGDAGQGKPSSKTVRSLRSEEVRHTKPPWWH